MMGFSSRDVLRAASVADSVGDVRALPRPTRPKPLSAVAERIAAEHVPTAVSPVVVAGLIRLADILTLLAIGIAAFFAYLPAEDWGVWPYASLVIAIPPLGLFAFQVADVYTMPNLRNAFGQFGRLGAGWTIVFGLAVAALFFSKSSDQLSRVWLGSWYVAGILYFAASRAGISALVQHWTRTGRLIRRAVVVGGTEVGEGLVEALSRDKLNDVRICGVFDDRSDRVPSSVGGLPKLGTVDDLVEFARRTRLDLVIFAMPITAEGRILDMLRKLAVLPVDVRLSAHSNKLKFRPRAYSYIGSVPVLDVFDKPIADWDVVVKWLFDKTVGLAALVALSPVMLGVALAVKLTSKGPILFRQKRYGFNNELIEVFKFRSMYVEQSDADAAKLVTKGDPRVTPVGRFIRKSSLDELPQLFNVVFKGNLSLVGPRPHAVSAKAANRLYDEVVDGYFKRHKVKPGITGYAQINGWRGETDTPEKIQARVEHDLYYIENWSIWLDIMILLKTPFALAKTENAY